MSWQRIKCAIVGHKLVPVGERLGVAGAHDCTRCGYHSPAVVWPRGANANPPPHYPKPLMAESHRVPPMPACKPPAESVSNVDLMCEIKAMREEIRRMRDDLVHADGWQRVDTTPVKGERIKGVMSSGAGYQPTRTDSNPKQPPRKP